MFLVIINRIYCILNNYRYSGFKEVRSIHPAKGIAFVEYDTEPQAMIAKEALSNHLIAPEHKLKITYAKK